MKDDGIKENERNTAAPVTVKRIEEAIRRKRNAKEDAIKYAGSSRKIKKGAVNVREPSAEGLEMLVFEIGAHLLVGVILLILLIPVLLLL